MPHAKTLSRARGVCRLASRAGPALRAKHERARGPTARAAVACTYVHYFRKGRYSNTDRPEGNMRVHGSMQLCAVTCVDSSVRTDTRSMHYGHCAAAVGRRAGGRRASMTWSIRLLVAAALDFVRHRALHLRPRRRWRRMHCPSRAGASGFGRLGARRRDDC